MQKITILDLSSCCDSTEVYKSAIYAIRATLKKSPKEGVVCLCLNKYKEYFNELWSIASAFGVPIYSTSSLHNDISALSESYDSKIVSADKTLTQFLEPDQNTVVDIESFAEYNYHDIKQQLGLSPELTPLVVALYGDARVGLSPISNVSLDVLRSLTASNPPHAHIPRLKVMDSELDVQALQDRLAVMTPSYPLEAKHMSVTRTPLSPDLLYRKYIQHGCAEFLPDNVRVKNGITLESIKVDQIEDVSDFTSRVARMKSVYLHVLDGGSAVIANVDLGVARKFKVPSEEYSALIGYVSENDSIRVACNSMTALYPTIKGLGLNEKQIVMDAELAAYMINPVRYRKGFSSILEQDTYIKLDAVLSDSTPLEVQLKEADIGMRYARLAYAQMSSVGSLKFYKEVELPLATILQDMSATGVKIDKELLVRKRSELLDDYSQQEEQLFKSVGRQFNLNAPKDIASVIYDHIGVPDKYAGSTKIDVLKEIGQQYPIVDSIASCRQLSTILREIDKVVPSITDEGLVHATYNQKVAVTGRLSTSDPNLQGLPKRSKEARYLREALVSDFGYKILAADYSQIELRVLAHLSKDPALLQAFNSGADIHTATAALVFSKPFEGVSSEERRRAKAINFGIIYGMSSYGLAQELGVPEKEAVAFIGNYFSKMPKVRTFIDSCQEFAQSNGYVETLLGRRIYIDGFNNNNYGEKQSALRKASNAPMQGTAADIIKKAMVDVNRTLKAQSGLKSKMIMQVHDELVIDIAHGELEIVSTIVRNAMESVLMLDVPLTVDVEVGDNWYNQTLISAKPENNKNLSREI
ncbi:DNA polymerase [Vibrio breoganii]